MSIVIFHETLNYRTTDKILRNTSLNEWQKYAVIAAPRNPLCTIIKVGNDFTLYLYDNIKDWRIKIRKTSTEIRGNNDVHTVQEGNRCASSDSIIIFLWSLFNNFSSRNAAEFNEREHNLYRHLGNFFYFHRNKYEDIINDWKINAIECANLNV